jgi:hypothetical protein
MFPSLSKNRKLFLDFRQEICEQNKPMHVEKQALARAYQLQSVIFPAGS